MISVLVFVAALLTSSISILTPHALAQTSPPAVSMNMTSGNTTSTSNNSTNATTTATAELGNKKTFYVFSEENLVSPEMYMLLLYWQQMRVIL